MKKLILLFAFSSLVAAAQPTTIQITKKMLDNPTKMKLSELVDDISFIKFETKKECFVKSTLFTKYSKDYIYLYVNHAFTWDGKWEANIGQPGRGPYEEPMGVSHITFKDGKFYSKGDKLIEYDANGKPTKKIRNLWGEVDESKTTGSTLRSAASQLVVVGNSLFIAAPDAVYYVNPVNFETVKRIQLIPNKVPTDIVAQNNPGVISFYRDNIIYHNPYIDTVFYVKDKSLQPIWKLQIDKDIKMSLDGFHKILEHKKDFARGGKLQSNLRNGKIGVFDAYETDNYVCLIISRFSTDKSGDTRTQHYLFYDKKLKTSRVVRKADFVDDIFGLGEYDLKIIDNKIVMALWPDEIWDRIEKTKAAGGKISPKLAALAKQIDEGDNPIIFVAHLKK